MPVEIGWCDVCGMLTCENQQECDDERKRLVACCDACGQEDCTDPRCIESALALTVEQE